MNGWQAEMLKAFTPTGGWHIKLACGHEWCNQLDQLVPCGLKVEVFLSSGSLSLPLRDDMRWLALWWKVDVRERWQKDADSSAVGRRPSHIAVIAEISLSLLPCTCFYITTNFMQCLWVLWLIKLHWLWCFKMVFYRWYYSEVTMKRFLCGHFHPCNACTCKCLVLMTVGTKLLPIGHIISVM